MIKVLMALHDLQVTSGVSSYVMNYFRLIDPDKIRMDFAIWEDIETPYYDEIRKRGAEVHILPSVKHLAKHVSACRSILKNGGYDIVHDNTLLISCPLMIEARRQGIPVRILHSHNSRLGETRYKEIRNKTFFPLLKNTATDYAACSKPAAMLLTRGNEYAFIPNIVPESDLTYSEQKRNQIRAEMGVSDRIIIGTVGRTAAQKNPLFALKIMEQLMADNSNVEYWWIGSGPMDDELKQHIEQSPYRDRIRFLGSRADVKDLYQAMDVFFLPSLFEGLPVTGVEAQAMGLPCVMSSSITNEVVYTDLVKFVDLNAPDTDWEEAVTDQIAFVADRRSYKQELMQSRFSPLRAGGLLLDVYSEMLDRRKTISNA